ncbi:MAG: hypothetical protein ABI670_19580 [Chloroflexota bacterium]
MKYEDVWHHDGTLRDIYIPGVTISHWQRVLDWLHTKPYPIEFYLGKQSAPLPRDVSTVFEQRNEIGSLLAIDVASVMVHCHFFWHKEIEFDLDPRHVDSEGKERGITDFMRALGVLLNSEVILTPENQQNIVLLAYLPEKDKIVHNAISLEPTGTIELSREEGLRLMARAYGVDENDEAAVIEKALEAASKPAYEED